MKQLLSNYDAEHELDGDAGPVGQAFPKRPVSVTLVRRDQKTGRWIYGPEIEADEETVSRSLPRGEHTYFSTNNDRTFRRTEYTFDRHRLELAGVVSSTTMVLAEMPPDQAMIFRAPLQIAGAKRGVSELPESYDIELEAPLKSGINPLVFTTADHPERRARSDLDAIGSISLARKDIYLTDPAKFRASFASDLVRESVFPYRPTQAASRWFLSRGSNKGRLQRLGLVECACDQIASLHRDIVQELWPKAEFWNNAIETERYVGIAGHRRRFDPELAGYLPNAVSLAVWQALAGADPAKNIGEGDEVSDLGARYLEHHLRIWNDAITRSALFGMDGPEAEIATQDQFEYVRAMASIEEAPDERSKLHATLTVLRSGHLQVDPDVLDQKIREVQRKLDELPHRRA